MWVPHPFRVVCEEGGKYELLDHHTDPIHFGCTLLAVMPRNLLRYQKGREFHFLTFSCYHREPLLADAEACRIFEQQLERARQRFEFIVAGYVLMPEHVHLLLSEPRSASLAIALQVLKQKTSHLLKRSADHAFWQRRYYDFNVWSQEKVSEKLRYMHRNPVGRGLVAKPEEWPWSSFRHYATGCKGTVEVESFWTATQRGNELPDSFTCKQIGP